MLNHVYTSIIADMSDLNAPTFTLRNFRLSDWPTIVENMNNPMVTRYLSSVPSPYGRSEAESFIKMQINEDESDNSSSFNKVITVNDEVIGSVGFRLSNSDSTGLLGYWLAEKWWGRGIMTDAVKQITHIGFMKLGLSKIVASTHFANPGSQSVLRKAGFKYVGDGAVRKWNDVEIPVHNFELYYTN